MGIFKRKTKKEREKKRGKRTNVFHVETPKDGEEWSGEEGIGAK